MSIGTQRNYKRMHLRAPYRDEVLYTAEDFVFKAKALNLSEGGLLLDSLPYFPKSHQHINLMLSLTQFPFFKNYSLSKLQSYTDDLFDSKVIRLKAQIVRKEELKDAYEHAFITRIGVKFNEIAENQKSEIANYVTVFSSNLIYLQVLIDSLNADKSCLPKIRLLAEILGYASELKISELRQMVQKDYMNLQWG